MADKIPRGMTPTYVVFHRWLAKHRRQVKAGHNQTVIYTGVSYAKGEAIGEWKRLRDHADGLYAYCGWRPRWQPLEAVLRRLKCRFQPFQGDLVLPERLRRYDTMWDFACQAPKDRLVSGHEGAQIWLNLSAAYARNATGGVFIWQGEVLKRYPDLLLAEIPVLAKNRNITTNALKKVLEMVPGSRATWERYRADGASRRLDGRR